MERDVHVESVEAKETRNGNVRYVMRDSEGNEYTTFRPQIGKHAMEFEGRRARISFHEEERNGFTNIYLDSVAPPEPAEDDGGEADTDAEEAAWRTAIEAAPWLLGESEPNEPAKPEEVFEKLKPFQELVADDIRDGDDDSPE